MIISRYMMYLVDKDRESISSFGFFSLWVVLVFLLFMGYITYDKKAKAQFAQNSSKTEEYMSKSDNSYVVSGLPVSNNLFIGSTSEIHNFEIIYQAIQSLKSQNSTINSTSTIRSE